MRSSFSRVRTARVQPARARSRSNPAVTFEAVEVRQGGHLVGGYLHAVDLVDHLQLLFVFVVGGQADEPVDEPHGDAAEADVLFELEPGLGHPALDLPAHGLDGGGAAGTARREPGQREKGKQWDETGLHGSFLPG